MTERLPVSEIPAGWVCVEKHVAETRLQWTWQMKSALGPKRTSLPIC